MKHYTLGNILDGQESLRHYGHDWEMVLEDHRVLKIHEEELNTHVLVLGTTGGGKSRLLWQLLREHRRNRRGFCLIDPGDLVEDFLADCAREILETGDRRLLKRIHVVELNPFQLARIDPFRFSYPKPIHPELMQTVLRSWQHTKVQSVAEIFQWKQGQSTDFESMPRLQRMFINVFTALSTLVDAKRLTLGDAQLLIDLGHPDHLRVYRHLQPHLPREIEADMEVLHRFTSMRDIRTETESFLNRIRSMLGPLMKQLLSGDGTLPSLDLYRIIQRGEFLLVKVARTPFASNDQNLALAGLFIHDVIETVLLTPRELRKPFTLMIDEAHKYVNPGIGDIARTARKYQLGLVLATTDLASLKKGAFDLAPELLSVVNTVISFRLTWPDDLKTIAEFLYAQNIDFTALLHEVERRTGQLEWIPVQEWSETLNRQTGTAVTQAMTVSSGTASQETSTHSTQERSAVAYTPGSARASTSRGDGTAASHAASASRNESLARQEGSSRTQTEGYGLTVSHKLVHLEKIVRELQKTGSLEQSVSDQLARFAQIISGQGRRRATARIREQPAVEIETVEVNDPFLSAEAQAKAVEWIKRELYATHPYYFTPALDPAEDERRIRAFLGEDEGEENRMIAAQPARSAPGGDQDRSSGKNGSAKGSSKNPYAT